MAEGFVCPICNKQAPNAERGSCGTPGHVPMALEQRFSGVRWVSFLSTAWLVIVICLVWVERDGYGEAARRGDISEARRLALVSGLSASLLLLVASAQVRLAQWAQLRRAHHDSGPAADLRPVLLDYMLCFRQATCVAWMLITGVMAFGLWQLDWLVPFLYAVLRRL
ncbi:MAG: hypothetical protein HZB16_07200 [Armatimonadetes bacterium]|nr:hypothetical protein [Armatimonadota bacterium]